MNSKLLILAFLALPVLAPATVITYWDFNNTLFPQIGSGSFNATWTGGGAETQSFGEGTLLNAVDETEAGQSIRFTDAVTAFSDHQAVFSNLNFSGFTEERFSFALRSDHIFVAGESFSVEGYINGDLAYTRTFFNPVDSWSPKSAPFPVEFEGATDVTFILKTTATFAVGETLEYDNVHFTGTPVAVPEPGISMLLGLGLLLVFAARKRLVAAVAMVAFSILPAVQAAACNQNDQVVVSWDASLFSGPVGIDYQTNGAWISLKPGGNQANPETSFANTDSASLSLKNANTAQFRFTTSPVATTVSIGLSPGTYAFRVHPLGAVAPEVVGDAFTVNPVALVLTAPTAAQYQIGDSFPVRWDTGTTYNGTIYIDYSIDGGAWTFLHLDSSGTPTQLGFENTGEFDFRISDTGDGTSWKLTSADGGMPYTDALLSANVKIRVRTGGGEGLFVAAESPVFGIGTAPVATPTTVPTPAPIPTLQLLKIPKSTKGKTLFIRGTASAAAALEYRVNRAKLKAVPFKTAFVLKVKLRLGKNRIAIRATGPGGGSAWTDFKVVRK